LYIDVIFTVSPKNESTTSTSLMSSAELKKLFFFSQISQCFILALSFAK
jgi:hypothetical protein